MSKTNQFKCHSSVQTTLNVLGGKWKVLILWHLLEKKMRFNELQRSVGSISQKILASELRSLESNGVVHRKIYPQVPPKVEYWITPYGESLRPVLIQLASWGEKHNHKTKKKNNILK
jgi:DNA-binding HxlR family transcriptional regulator